MAKLLLLELQHEAGQIYGTKTFNSYQADCTPLTTDIKTALLNPPKDFTDWQKTT